MLNKEKKLLVSGLLLIVAFVIFTVIVMTVDVQPVGAKETHVGLASFNCWFHNMTDVHLDIYIITDWMGLIPVLVCMFFCILGLIQLIKNRCLFKVDWDILILGIYYVIVITLYIVFEMITINYRPILIDGRLEASYPSSTTLLVLSVMPTLVLQSKRRISNKTIQNIITILTFLFSAFMVLGRLISGVHWLTDIIAAIILSSGVFCIYEAACLIYCNKEK